jgi:hypothetical protein
LDVVGHGPRRGVGLFDRESGAVEDAVGLCSYDADTIVTVKSVEPPGRPRAEASIPVEDERGGTRNRVR